MRKILEAIGKVTIRLMAIVIGIYIARFLRGFLGESPSASSMG